MAFPGQLGSAGDVNTDPGPRKTQFLTLSTGSDLGVFGESLDLSGLFPHLEDGPTALKATEQLSHTALSGPSVDPEPGLSTEGGMQRVWLHRTQAGQTLSWPDTPGASSVCSPGLGHTFPGDI